MFKDKKIINFIIQSLMLSLFSFFSIFYFAKDNLNQNFNEPLGSILGIIIWSISFSFSFNYFFTFSVKEKIFKFNLTKE